MKHILLPLLLFLLIGSSFSYGEEELALIDWLDIPGPHYRSVWDEKNECNWLKGLSNGIPRASFSYRIAKENVLRNTEGWGWLEKNWELGCRDWLITYFHYLPKSPRFEQIDKEIGEKISTLLESQPQYFEPGGDFERMIDLKTGEWKKTPLLKWLNVNCVIETVFDENALMNNDENEVLRQTIAVEYCLAWIERIVKYEELWSSTRFVVGQYFMNKLLTSERKADYLPFRLQVHSTLCRYLWEHKAKWMKALAVVESVRIIDFYHKFTSESWKTYVGLTLEARLESTYEDTVANTKTRDFFSIGNWEKYLKQYLVTLPVNRRVAIVNNRPGWSAIHYNKNAGFADYFTYFSNERPQTPVMYFKRRRFLKPNPPKEVEVEGKIIRQASPRTPGEVFELTLEDNFLNRPLVLMRYYIANGKSLSMPDFNISSSHVSHHDIEITVCWESNNLIRFFTTTFSRKEAFNSIDKLSFESFKNAPLLSAVKPDETSGEQKGTIINIINLLPVNAVKSLKNGAKVTISGTIAASGRFLVFTQIENSEYVFERVKSSDDWSLRSSTNQNEIPPK